MEYREALNYLWDIGFFGVKFGLENIAELLEKLGNPHEGMRFIHIAGTNGKGSVGAMLSAVLKQKYKIGFYTSPHLEKFNERIKINDVNISDEDVARLTEMVKPLRGSNTFFETVTGMALIYFKEQQCDYVIMEVGMGGRLDATNIINPQFTVITNVTVEHTEHLGQKIKDIAKEKAGIIKHGVPVITASEKEALNVINEKTAAEDAEVIIAKPITHDEINCNLLGEFQEKNMGCAVEVLKKMDLMTMDEIKKGMQNVIWPGRFEKKNNIIMDCAHNPAAMLAIRKEIRKLAYKNLIVVFGVMSDKDISRIVKIIYPISDKFIITKPKIQRSAEPKVISEGLAEYEIIEDTAEAIAHAISIASDDDLILVCGSIFLIGEIRKHVVG